MESMSKLLLVAAALLAFFGGALGQTKMGTIKGVVMDVNGAVVWRAKVVVTTGTTSTSLETNEDGAFRIAVPIGISRITIQSPGFDIAKLNRVRVSAGRSRSLKIVLKVEEIKYGPCPPKLSPCVWL